MKNKLSLGAGLMNLKLGPSLAKKNGFDFKR
jgi:hypothetical protein